MENKITTQVYRPECAANPGSRWMGEVRNNGWLIDYTYKDTEEEINTWLKSYTGTEMAPKLFPVYADMIKKYS
jgi:hypothetical protein